MTLSSRLAAVWHALTNNPISIKELRSRMRGPRAFAVLTIYLLLATGLVVLIYASYNVNSTPTASSSREVGQAVFVTMILVQGFLVIFMAPAFTAGAISGEKERQTYDLLRTTLLSPSAFILGKLISALSYIFLLLVSAIPLLSLSLMLGGVAISEVIISQLMLGTAAILYAMLGLYFSCTLRSTMSASVATYAVAFFLTIGTPLLAALFGSIAAGILFSASSISSNSLAEAVLTYVGLILSTTNLPASLIISDVFLREQNTLWGYTYTVGGYSLWVFSPWYLNVLFHMLLTWFLFRRATRVVDKIATK